MSQLWPLQPVLRVVLAAVADPSASLSYGQSEGYLTAGDLDEADEDTVVESRDLQTRSSSVVARRKSELLDTTMLSSEA